MFRLAVETGFHRPTDRTPWELKQTSSSFEGMPQLWTTSPSTWPMCPDVMGHSPGTFAPWRSRCLTHSNSSRHPANGVQGLWAGHFKLELRSRFRSGNGVSLRLQLAWNKPETDHGNCWRQLLSPAISMISFLACSRQAEVEVILRLLLVVCGVQCAMAVPMPDAL